MKETSEQQAVPVAQERESALATAFCLLDTFAGEGLGHTYGNGQKIDADTTVFALCSAFDMEPEVGWYRALATELADDARLTPIEGVAASELEAGKDELRRLMDSIWRAEYRKDAPNWEPLDDLPGMVSQIDNMYAGIRGQRDQARWDLHNPATSPAIPEGKSGDGVEAVAASLTAQQREAVLTALLHVSGGWRLHWKYAGEVMQGLTALGLLDTDSSYLNAFGLSVRLALTPDATQTREAEGERSTKQMPQYQGCNRPPDGWWCCSEAGHDGPCPTRRMGEI